jgi:hypothetical protein
MVKRLRVLLTLACVIGATTAVGLVSAGAAQASCVSNDTSGYCHWTFPTAGDNTPNLIEQSNDVPLTASTSSYGCFTGYWWNGSGWQAGSPGEQCISNSSANLFNSAATGQTEHALMNSGPNNVEVFFTF